jgi:hypothetical protein
MKIIIVASLMLGHLTVNAAEHNNYSCKEGVYSALSTIFKESGESQTSADSSTRYCFYKGQGEVAEYRSLDTEGNVIFRGVSITLWEPSFTYGRTLWAMVGVDGWTDIQLHWDEKKLVSKGQGHDPQGSFLERWSTTFAENGDEYFVMDRSYDNGLHWIAPTNVIEYISRKIPLPSLPTHWSSHFATIAPKDVNDDGIIILDGKAWIKFNLSPLGKPLSVIFASVAPKDNELVWRRLEFSAEEGIVSVVDSALANTK